MNRPAEFGEKPYSLFVGGNKFDAIIIVLSMGSCDFFLHFKTLYTLQLIINRSPKLIPKSVYIFKPPADKSTTVALPLLMVLAL